ncbi:MAG: hypothetical protein AB1523_00155 [Bacillota bacterium]
MRKDGSLLEDFVNKNYNPPWGLGGLDYRFDKDGKVIYDPGWWKTINRPAGE